MSEEAPSTRKEKKARRDAERLQQKGKKRKHVETVVSAEHDAPNHGLDTNADYVPLSEAAGDEGDRWLDTAAFRTTKKRKTNKSPKRDAEHVTEEPARAASEQPAAPRKKRRKVKKDAVSDVAGTSSAGDAESKKPRFIVFVGNLPYSTTDASLKAHFKKLEPFTVRHRVDPEKKRSKGFAFLEFDSFDRMETCLKLYHHSMFDPEEHTANSGNGDTKKKKGARRINVELTAGGGGKASARMDKIRAKNIKLEEERRRRVEMEQYEKSKQDQGSKSTARGKHIKLDGTSEPEAETSSMHPSRLARIGG